jgi:hypothetical protein
MRKLGVRVAALVAGAAPISFLLFHCGSNATHAGASAATQDASDTIEATPCVAADPGAAGSDAGGAASLCPGALTCCSGFCRDTSKDPRNCGSCGNACTGTQFCNGASCNDAVLKNLCANPQATVVFDQFPGDNDAGQQLAAAIAMGCGSMTSIRALDQGAGTAEDPATGRPLTGPGDTLVAGGGLYGQKGVAYMEANGLTPVVVGSSGDNNLQIRNTKTNALLVSVSNTVLTAHHDFVVLEVSVEPMSGTLCFFGYGLGLPGTLAAAFYYKNKVVPNRATYSGTWYLYEWTDTDNNGVPDDSDMFTLIASG